MRKLMILMATLMVAAAVPASPRAIAQTALASKDADVSTTLSAQQHKQQGAQVRNVGRANAPARSVTRSVGTAQGIVRQSGTTRSVVRQSGTTRSFTRQTTTTRRVTQGTGTHIGRTGVTHGPGTRLGKTDFTREPRGKTGLTQGPGLRGKGDRLGHDDRGRGDRLGRGDRSRGDRLGRGDRGRGDREARRDHRGEFHGWHGGPRHLVIHRGHRRIFVHDHWHTFVPLAALGVFTFGAETLYADGYLSVPEPVCYGVSEDGCRLRWQLVPTEEGDAEYQCVQYCAQRDRAVTEIPLAAEPETVGVGRPGEAAAPPPPAAPATGCELLIYSEANFKGLSAPANEDQPGLSETGWRNEIASLDIKSGTWDFYSDEDYAGDMMRLSAGSYPTLDPKWSKHIGSFMCSSPAK